MVSATHYLAIEPTAAGVERIDGGDDEWSDQSLSISGDYSLTMFSSSPTLNVLYDLLTTEIFHGIWIIATMTWDMYKIFIFRYSVGFRNDIFATSLLSMKDSNHIEIVTSLDNYLRQRDLKWEEKAYIICWGIRKVWTKY